MILKNKTLPIFPVFMTFLVCFASSLSFVACSDDKSYTEPETSPVVMDLSAVPYPKLSDYHFFEGEMKNQEPVFGLVPYKPASELFSDYAEKQRFIWMPDNTTGAYNGDANILELPVGAALVKSFYYNNVLPSNTKKIVETRLMIHKVTGWIFSNYVWNEAQTEAFLQTTGSTVAVSWTDAGGAHSINYQIPSANNCATCHGNDGENFPIGIKPQNLNYNYAYPEGNKNQLNKLVEFGYLENTLPPSIVSVANYNDMAQSLDLRVRSYFDSNCAHCHSDGGSADYIALRFAFNLTGNPENMGVCVGAVSSPPGIPHGMIVAPNDISQSVLHYSMSTNSQNFRMPRLGRTIVHTEAVSLVEQWINSLPECAED